MDKFKFYALKLCLIILAVFVFQVIFPGFTELFVLNQNAWIEIWRFCTAIFLHGGVGHLVYNLFALALFGSILEKLIGEKKFMLVFFVTGILANLFAVNFYSFSLGASGAIFGVIGALIVVRPMMFIWAFGLPMPIFIAGILWVVGDVIGAVAFLTGNPINNTGSLAHLSGMAFGLILGAFFRKRKFRKKK